MSIPSDTTSSTLFPHRGQDNSPRRKWTSAAIAPRFSARSGAPRSGRPTDRRLGPPPVSSGELSSPYLVTCPLILMVALQKEESTAKSDSAQCRGSSLLLVPLRPNLAVQCQLLEDLLGGAVRLSRPSVLSRTGVKRITLTCVPQSVSVENLSRSCSRNPLFLGVSPCTFSQVRAHWP